MELRGPILIVFAASLIASPWAIKTVRGDAPNIDLIGAARASCEARGLDTAIGRLGCSNTASTRTRTYKSGGALFVSR